MVKTQLEPSRRWEDLSGRPRVLPPRRVTMATSSWGQRWGTPRPAGLLDERDGDEDPLAEEDEQQDDHHLHDAQDDHWEEKGSRGWRKGTGGTRWPPLGGLCLPSRHQTLLRGRPAPRFTWRSSPVAEALSSKAALLSSTLRKGPRGDREDPKPPCHHFPSPVPSKGPGLGHIRPVPSRVPRRTETH